MSVLQYETSEARFARLQSWPRYDQERRFRYHPHSVDGHPLGQPLPPVQMPTLPASVPPLPVNVMAGVAGVPPSNVGPPPPPAKKPPAKKKPPAAKKKSSGDVYCKTKFNANEVKDLMRIIGNILPVGMVQWEMVEAEYNHLYPTRMRTTDNLRRQFNRNVKKKVPTGNPNIPRVVREAKRIQQDIIGKAQAVHMGGGDDSDDDSVAIGEEEVGGDEEEQGDSKPAAKPSAVKSSSSNGRATPRARNTAATRQDAANKEFLQAYIATQRARDEQQQQRERLERRQIRRLEKLEREQQRRMPNI